MAKAIQVAGTCLIRTNVSGSLADLGYSINGVSIRAQDFMEPVPGDENGGDAGPPIDILKLGQIDVVTIQMSKWDDPEALKLESRIKNGTAGSVTQGVLYAANDKGVRLLLTAPNFTRNYLLAIPRGPIETDKIGLRFAIKTIQFECHAVNGVLWNQVTS